MFTINCSNPTCGEDITGTYNGSCESSLNNAEFEGPLLISLSETDPSRVIIQDQTLGDGEETYEGRLNNDCNRIDVPSQSFISENQLPFAISGFFDIDGNTLTGEIEILVGVSGSFCTYTMTKEE